jgi:peptide-methionine (R)-S-oxide reductase
VRRRDLLVMFSATAVLGCLPSSAPAGTVAQAPTRKDAVRKTLAEWKALLPPERYHILFEKGTERAFTGAYWDHHEDGVYPCAACDLELFDSKTKFNSGTGWPSFWAPVGKDNVAEHEDSSYFMVRTEVLCNRCGGHLGHVFNDGPQPTGLRYCINSASLTFRPRTAKPG